VPVSDKDTRNMVAHTEWTATTFDPQMHRFGAKLSAALDEATRAVGAPS